MPSTFHLTAIYLPSASHLPGWYTSHLPGRYTSHLPGWYTSHLPGWYTSHIPPIYLVDIPPIYLPSTSHLPPINLTSTWSINLPSTWWFTSHLPPIYLPSTTHLHPINLQSSSHPNSIFLPTTTPSPISPSIYPFSCSLTMNIICVKFYVNTETKRNISNSDNDSHYAKPNSKNMKENMKMSEVRWGP